MILQSHRTIIKMTYLAQSGIYQLRSNTATYTLLYNLWGTNNLRPYKRWKIYSTLIFNSKQPKRPSIHEWNLNKLLRCHNKYNNPPQLTSLLYYRNLLEVMDTDIYILHAIVWRKIHIQWLAPANIPMQLNNWRKSQCTPYISNNIWPVQLLIQILESPWNTAT